MALILYHSSITKIDLPCLLKEGKKGKRRKGEKEEE
jgi:hypothetical protein